MNYLTKCRAQQKSHLLQEVLQSPRSRSDYHIVHLVTTQMLPLYVYHGLESYLYW